MLKREDLKGGKRNMKKLFGVFILASVLLTLGFVSAQVAAPEKCNGLDLCAWTTSTGHTDVGLPLSSGYYSPCSNLNPSVYTQWDLNTDATVTCTFGGEELDLGTVMLYISIDNDVLDCTLNGNSLGTIQDSEGCAILDPMVPEGGRTGYLSTALPASTGTNTLICHVRDRGYMAYFDACVVASEEVEDVCGNGVKEGGEECDDGNLDDYDGCTTNCTISEDITVPEFGAVVGILTALGALGAFFVVRRH
jgi:cysteine-rich repeat protein